MAMRQQQRVIRQLGDLGIRRAKMSDAGYLVESDPSEESVEESREGIDLGRMGGNRKETGGDVQRKDVGIQLVQSQGADTDRAAQADRQRGEADTSDTSVPASKVKMDQIKPPKNLILSRESMNAALDALLAGQSVGEATQRVAEVISSRSATRPPPPPASSQAPRPSSRRSKSSRPSSRSRSSSASQSSQAPQSRRASNEGTKEAPGVISGLVKDTEPARTDPVLPFEEVLEVRVEAPAVEERAPDKEMEVIPAGEGA
ncbi:uncharacterized protein LOC122723987 [Manihot esculenta]|uniref:uncharacterized protein LOC122723987 n=1 Tax=Manihot esculenta TaxID=3983 RepID=UPI001CC82537|nr:uncharacterized protein LOC122723987 [Manihot esculenta]